MLLNIVIVLFILALIGIGCAVVLKNEITWRVFEVLAGQVIFNGVALTSGLLSANHKLTVVAANFIIFNILIGLALLYFKLRHESHDPR